MNNLKQNNGAQRCSGSATLARHSIGVLWNGNENESYLDFTSPQQLISGACPNSNDIRIAQLSGKLLEGSCQGLLCDKVDGLSVSDVSKKQILDYISSFMAATLRYAICLAGSGIHNMTVEIETTIVHGRPIQHDDSGIKFYIVDSLCERCDIDLTSFIEETLSKAFEELGFFVQKMKMNTEIEHGNMIKNAYRCFRLSWFKPSIMEYREQVEDYSQIDAYISGVPIDDIFA